MDAAQTGDYKLISFTEAGLGTLKRVLKALKETEETASVASLKEWTGRHFKKGNILIYIGAAGIAVRAIAPFISDKTTDPAVIVIDEAGHFVIPILSGHMGGANKAAAELADSIGANAIITTATDIRGEFAVDLFAKENDLAINDMKLAKDFSARLLRGEDVTFTVSPRKHEDDGLYLIPRCVVAGMGCKKGKGRDELLGFLKECLDLHGYNIRAVKALVSVDLKKDEPGLVQLSELLNIPFITYSPETLMSQSGEFESSEFTLAVTGADNVCQRAVAAFGCRKIIQEKTTKSGMSVALGLEAEA